MMHWQTELRSLQSLARIAEDGMHICRASSSLRCAILVAALLGFAPIPVWADEMPPTVTAESCTSCHGPKGRSAGAIPTIAGMAAKDIATALTEYRDGARTGSIMGRLSGALGDAEIAAIASYFSSIEEAG
jgi:cytochrome c553